MEGLVEVVRERLGEEVAVVEADSAGLSRPRAAAALLLGGGGVEEVREAVGSAGATIVHAHNLLPGFGARALEAARQAGAKVVLHLHQFRVVCAVGVCFTRGAPCTRCHGRNTLPGVVRRCRGPLAESVVYGLALSLWQRRLLRAADVVLVPSGFAAHRLRELRAPLGRTWLEVLPPPIALEETSPEEARFALIASRLTPEKGVDLGLRACAAAGVAVEVAGDGPQRRQLEALATELGLDARFHGALPPAQLARLRRSAGVALVPSRSENFPTAAAEAMACAVPVAATDVGGIGELVPAEWLAPPDDVAALAQRIAELWGDHEAGEEGRRLVRERCAPELVAARLGAIYASLREGTG